MKSFVLLLLTWGLCASLYAQNISISEDYEVTRVMERYTSINKTTGSVAGWRIQLLATTDRNKMERVKTDFMQKYPYIAIDWIHSSPYYKLRAGAYASKLEATRILYIVKRDYPSAYPVQVKNVRPGELIGLRY